VRCRALGDHPRQPRFYMRLITIVCYLSVILSFISGCASRADAVFYDMVLNIGNEQSSEKIRLSHGEYHQEHVLHVGYDGKYVFGDFNRDGLRDAAVIIWESGGGSACWYELAFLINDGKKLVHQSTYELDDHAKINSIIEQDNKVIVDMSVHQEEDSHGGPTKHVINTYEYKGPDKWGPSFDEIVNR